MGDKTAFEEGQAQIIGIDNNKQIPRRAGDGRKTGYEQYGKYFHDHCGVQELRVFE